MKTIEDTRAFHDILTGASPYARLHSKADVQQEIDRYLHRVFHQEYISLHERNPEIPVDFSADS